jgi:hypothetical protein
MLIKDLEARVGIEPTFRGFADLSLTTWVPRPLRNPRPNNRAGSAVTARIPTLLCQEREHRLRRLERETGLEPATLALARRCSTTELLPRKYSVSISGRFERGQCRNAPIRFGSPVPLQPQLTSFGRRACAGCDLRWLQLPHCG